jgi:tripartite-type tricarboxylate transporter receptor subunit TctC
MAASIVSCSWLATAQADDVERFYKGKQINVVVSTGPVGTYAQYGRLLVEHMSQYIPGRPTLVFQTMPGAGGLIAANHAFNVAARDGTSLLVIGQNYALDQAIESPGVRYDARKFNIIGRFTDNTTVSLGWRSAGVTSIETVMQREVNTGGTGAASPTDSFPRMLNAIAGTRFKIIAGYRGLDELMMSMERGETETMITSLQSLDNIFKRQLDEKKVAILVQFSPQRHKSIPDVPTAGELSKTGNGKLVADLVGSTAEIGRAVVAPPDVPKERLDALRSAFVRMTQDTAFRADVEKQKLDLNPADVQALHALVERTLSAPPDVVAETRKILAVK